MDSIEWGATRYIHPPTHPANMITGLATVATTGEYWHLRNIPTWINSSGNADRVGGIRVSIQDWAPGNPQVHKEIWINPVNRLIYIYRWDGWQALHAVWA